MNSDTLLKYALLVLAILAPIIIGLLARGMLKGIGAWREKLMAETKSGLAREAISRILHIGEMVVLDIENTLKPAIAKALEDRQLTAEERRNLRDLALSRLKAVLTEQGKQELMGFLGIAGGALDAYLGGVVESAVVKAQLPPVTTAATVVATPGTAVVTSPLVAAPVVLPPAR